MDNGAVIALIIVVGIVIVVYLLRDRITGLRARASVDKREGEFEVKAAKPAAKPQPSTTSSQPTEPPSINISGNKAFGKTRVNIERDDVGVTGNTLVGNTQIEVKDSSPKKPRK